MSRKTRKLIWSVPLVAVFAVVGALVAFGALGIGGVFANETTNQPMNLKVSPDAGSAGRTALVLTWDAPASGETPTGYRVDVSKDNKAYTFLAMTDANTRTYKHSGVPGSTDGTTRYYRVFATNQHGAGRVSTWEDGVTTKITTPGQVRPFDWSSTDPTKVVLTWTAPDDGGAAILGYCIRAWPTDTTALDEALADADVSATECTNSFATEGPGGLVGDYAAGPGGIIRILPATTYTHSNLKAKQKWSYEIYAVNKHGYSEKVSATRNATTAAAKNPTSPGDLLPLQITGNTPATRTINLYWTKPDAMGQNISGYEIEVSDRRNHWPGPSSAVAVGDRLGNKVIGIGVPQGQLGPDPDYDRNDKPNVTVIAITVESQEGDDANPASDTPFQLQHVYEGVDDDASGTVEADEFAKTLYYRVRTITNNDAGDSELKGTAYTSASVVIRFNPALDDSVVIGFTAPILAPLVGADAASEADEPANQDTTGSDVADTEPDRTPAALRLHTSHQNTGSTAANGYRVDVSTDDGKTWVTHETASRPINEYDFRGPDVKPGERYRFRLFSKKGGYGLSSGVVQDYAGHSKPPGEVRNLTATENGAGMINLSWNKPTSDGGATIDTYCIVASQDGGDDAAFRGEIEVVDDPDTDELEADCTRFGEPDKSPITIGDDVFQVSGSTTSVAFKSVLAETQWFFRVYGLNGATGPTDPDGEPPDGKTLEEGLAEGSERNDATTDSAVAPGAPGYLTAEDARDTNFQGVGQQGVLVLWTAPSNPAGAPVIGYKVERSTDGGDFTTLSDNLNTGDTHIVDDIERPTDESRVYRVTSINSVDVGTESITVTLPLAAHTTHPPGTGTGTLGEVSGVTATSVTDGEVTVMWTGGDNADRYFIIALEQGSDPLVIGFARAESGASEATITGLNSDESHFVVVLALKGTGDDRELEYDTDIVTVQ